MRKSPPTRGVLVNYLDAHCASRTCDHAHGRFQVCSIEVWHLDLSDFLQLCFCDFCNFSLVRNTGTGLDLALFLDEYRSRWGLGNKGKGTVGVNGDDNRDDHADVVFGSLVADEPEIEFVPVVNQEMVIITPPEHPLKYKKKLVLEDLLDYPVIGYDKTSGLGRFTNSIYKQNHIKPSIAFESSDENAIASLVAEDFGIGFVAHVESLQAYDVEILHLSNVKPYHTVYMAYLKNMPMIPAVRKFIEFTKETIDIFY